MVLKSRYDMNRWTAIPNVLSPYITLCGVHKRSTFTTLKSQSPLKRTHILLLSLNILRLRKELTLVKYLGKT
jgi:hypothetical protein